MARHQIKLKDKETVKQRLALGASTRQAIEGTSIKSNKTAATIAKQELHDITQIRTEFLEKIKEAGADRDKRAKVWAEAAIRPADKRPDWKTKLRALEYIDRLENVAPDEKQGPQEIRLTIQNYVTGETKVVYPKQS